MRQKYKFIIVAITHSQSRMNVSKNCAGSCVGSGLTLRALKFSHWGKGKENELEKDVKSSKVDNEFLNLLYIVYICVCVE